MNFTDEYKWDSVTGSVVFISKDDDKRLPHQISEEALEDKFERDGTAKTCIEAFLANRAEIQRLADIAMAEGQTNKYGGASITPEWLEKKGYLRS